MSGSKNNLTPESLCKAYIDLYKGTCRGSLPEYLLECYEEIDSVRPWCEKNIKPGANCDLKDCPELLKKLSDTICDFGEEKILGRRLSK
mmetsp:Transcript_10320/g.11855  ORF Transcript_10320/g.11855 Transcript_10320/m.11855 type:complete len:89 (+) Transcript_10320:499-765(+)